MFIASSLKALRFKTLNNELTREEAQTVLRKYFQENIPHSKIIAETVKEIPDKFDDALIQIEYE